MSAPRHDLRASRRVPIERPVRVSRSSVDTFYAGLVENISEGGVFVAADELLPIGTEVEFRIALDDGLPDMFLEGEVRWHRPESVRGGAPPGMGIRFAGLPESSLFRIRRFVQRTRETLLHDED